MIGDHNIHQKPVALEFADELYRYGSINDPNGAADELRRLHEENAFLLDRLKDARELVADWGTYASDYFQDKYGLKTDLSMLDAAIQRAENT